MMKGCYVADNVEYEIKFVMIFFQQRGWIIISSLDELSEYSLNSLAI